MDTSRRILDAILRIHEAPLTADGWTHTLPSIAAVTRSDIACMLIQDVVSGKAECVGGFQSAPDHLTAFAFAVTTGKLPDWIISMPVGGVLQSSSAISDRDFSRSAFYNEVVRPRGTFYGLVAKPLSGPRHRVFLTAGRRLGSDDFEQVDGDAVKILVPHIVTALQVGKRLAEVDLRANAARDVIDHLDTGLVLVDANGKVLFANRVAEGQLSGSEALGLKEGRLLLRAPRPDNALHCTIADCAATSSRLFHSKQVIDVPRGEGRPPLRLIVSPVRPKTVEAALPALGNARPSALILIADPEKERSVWKMHLRKEFGLTAAEAELALEIMKGDGREAAAARLGVTVATVRTHLLHIFDKTGVRRQAELVRLLLDRGQLR